MSDIRDRVREKVGFAICPENHSSFELCGRCMHYKGDSRCYNPRIDEVLSIIVDGRYEVAVVDRKAILENPNVRPLIRALDSTPDDHYHAGVYDGYLKCCKDLFGKGFVKEVKDNLDSPVG